MPTVVQFRRGTTAQNDAFTGAVGEISYDTENNTIRVHDGSTAGGAELLTGASNNELTNKTFGGDLLPSADSAYDLGSPAFKWKDLHLSGSTIFLGDVVLKDVGGVLNIQDSAGTALAGSFSSLTTTGDVTVGGNLTIEGTTTTINTTELEVEDKNIIIASGAADSAAADGAGITIGNIGVYFQYDATGDTWNLNKPFGSGFNALSEYSTTEIAEGNNLYYTTARADSDAKNSVSAGTGVTYSAATGVISTNDGEIVHDSLSGFVADEHVAHTSVTMTAGSGLTGGGDISATRTFNIGQGTGITVSADAIATNDGEIVHDNLSGFVADEHVAHSGVTLTAGIGLNGGGDISASRTFNIDSSELYSNFDHDRFRDYVANEHIDHSGVTMTAGTGLNGGGTIAATRTFNIDSAELYANFSLDGFNDYVANEHIDHTTVSFTAGSGLTGGGDISSSRSFTVGQGTGITVSADAIATNDAEIVHDNLSGFVADEHIAHSGVTMTAGSGLTGGGTIAATRTFNVGAGTGVTVNADDIAIGQDVATTADVTFNNITNNGYLDLKHDSDADLVPYSEGRMFYHNEYKTLTVLNDVSDVSLQVGLENWIRVYNNTGSTITNGTPVYITGASGETPTVAPADATTEAKAYVVGVVTHDIANASQGFATHFGLVSGIDTSALTAGQNVHVAADGSLQTAAPTYPYFPTDVGTCVVSDSSNGYLLVNIEHHTFEQFRVSGNQHIGGDLTVDGDLTVTGTQSVVSQANLAVDTSFIYTNSGDTIGTANTNFTGSGLDDAILTGHYKGTTSSKTFYVRIDGVGAGAGGVDTFEWSLDNFSTTEATDVDITGDDQALADGVNVNFNATTGHTLNDKWDGTASPVNVDAGFASNRNTGTSGVGYTHMGAFFDVTDEKWKFFKSYYPEPEGTINTSDSSYEKATIDANLSGNVTGTLTGDITGNAATATALATARNIGGVSFNGTANINLPGVNTTGNQNTSGNAATATTLATGRTISLTGDVTGTSASFDGSGNVSIAATIAANSVALGTDTTGNYVATIATGTGLDGASSTEGGAATITLDLSELTDMTAGVDGAADELILLDAGAERRKRIGEINLGQFNNDQGWTSNVGDITGVTAGTGLTGGGASGSVTLNVSGVTSSMFSSPNSLVIYNSAGTALKTIRGPGS